MLRFVVGIAAWPGTFSPLCVVEGETMAEAAASIGCRAPGAAGKTVAKLEVLHPEQCKLKLNAVMSETLIIMWVTGVTNADEFKGALRMHQLVY